VSDASGNGLVDGYDLVIFDLDGVVYLIDQPIPGAVETVGRLHAEGKPLAYATNNASRRSSEVAALLTGMGVVANSDEVVTSAAASAAVLAERLSPGAAVLVVGAEALRAEVRAVGLRPVTRADEAPAAVVQGYGPLVGWADLAEASVAVRAGALWIATNADRTLPSPRGPLPGNGSLVAALRTALGRDPDLVVGKPEPALFTTAAHRVGASRPLVVGDRLDTDIEGAVRAGMDSLLVLTGVSTAADLIAAEPAARPTYVARDLTGLFEAGGAVRVPGEGEEPGGTAGGGWRVTDDGPGPLLTGDGPALDALRVLCAAAWSGRSLAGLSAGSERARGVLKDFGLSD
jgi:glycerol 3-phosphatase-2